MNKDLSSTLLEEQKRLEEQEKMYVVCGKYYRKHGKQERATSFFVRANEAFKKRQQIRERLSLILTTLGVNIPKAEQFVKPLA